MTYSVTLEMHKVIEVAIEADDRDAALGKAEADNPGMAVTCVADDDVQNELIGRCEGCAKPIWDGDDYRTDSDGIELCLSCASQGEPS